MISTTLKAEYRKLLTVRSTYIVTGLLLAGIALISFFVFGRNQTVGQPVSPELITGAMSACITIFVLFSAIIAALNAVHEYRYNTIGYTLTASNSRLKVLGSKIIVVLSYGLVGGLLTCLVAALFAWLGVLSTSFDMVGQSIAYSSLWWQFSSYVVGYTLLGLALGLLLRNIIGMVVVIFVTPVVEALVGILLKDNAQYLPFRALDGIVTATTNVGSSLTQLASLGLASIYIVALLLITTIVFVKRDA